MFRSFPEYLCIAAWVAVVVAGLFFIVPLNLQPPRRYFIARLSDPRAGPIGALLWRSWFRGVSGLRRHTATYNTAYAIFASMVIVFSLALIGLPTANQGDRIPGGDIKTIIEKLSSIEKLLASRGGQTIPESGTISFSASHQLLLAALVIAIVAALAATAVYRERRGTLLLP